MSEKKDRGNWNVPEINIQPNDGGSIPGLSSGLFSPRVTSMRLHVTIDRCQELSQTMEDHEEVEHQQVRTSSVKVESEAAAIWNQTVNFDLTSQKSQVFLTVWGQGNVSETTQKIGGGYFEINTLIQDEPTVTELKINDVAHVLLQFRLYQHQSKKITENDFQRLKTIGKGSFGTVYLVRKIDTRNLYAMKVLIKHNVREKNAIKHTLNERAILKRVDHPFIVNLKFAFQTKDHLFMVMPYMNGGELFFHLSEGEDVFGEERARFYAAEITLAIAYLHENGVLYRDLKPENILLDMEGHISIVDFGLSKTNVFDGDKTETFCGSLEYMPPELLAGVPYTNVVDWWALATMVYEMIYGLPPFWDEEQPAMLEKICACNIDELEFDPALFSPECIDFIKSILQPVPEKRLGFEVGGAKKIKKHPWFKDIDWTKLYYKQITPPFRPHVLSEFDMRYFDKEVLALDPSKLDFAKPKHKRLLEIDDNFDNFSFEEVNAENNNNVDENGKARKLSKSEAEKVTRRQRRRSLGSHQIAVLSKEDPEYEEKSKIIGEIIQSHNDKTNNTTSTNNTNTNTNTTSNNNNNNVENDKQKQHDHKQEKKSQRKNSFTKNFFVSPKRSESVNEHKEKEKEEGKPNLKSSNDSSGSFSPNRLSPRDEKEIKQTTSPRLEFLSKKNSKELKHEEITHKRAPRDHLVPTIAQPEGIALDSGSTPNTPLKSSVSDNTIKEGTPKKERITLPTFDLSNDNNSPIKNRVSRSSSDSNIRARIKNKEPFFHDTDPGVQTARDVSNSSSSNQTLIHSPTSKQGLMRGRKLSFNGGERAFGGVGGDGDEEKKKKGFGLKKKVTNKEKDDKLVSTEKKKDKMSFRMSQGIDFSSRKEKEKNKLEDNEEKKNIIMKTTFSDQDLHSPKTQKK